MTTIVYLGLVRGRRYAIGWCLLALAAAIAGSAVQPRLLPLVVGYTVGLVAHLRCRPGDVASVTENETVIIFAGIAAALAPRRCSSRRSGAHAARGGVLVARDADRGRPGARPAA